MLVNLKNALARRLAAGEPDTQATLLAAIREGAVLRVRPKAMTVAVVIAGLLPIIVPAAWYLMHRRRVAIGLAASKLERLPAT